VIVVVKVASVSRRRLCPEEVEEGVREVGVRGIESSEFTCGGLCNEVSDWWVCHECD
jgi:hypothetical protein